MILKHQEDEPTENDTLIVKNIDDLVTSDSFTNPSISHFYAKLDNVLLSLSFVIASVIFIMTVVSHSTNINHFNKQVLYSLAYSLILDSECL